MFRDRNDAALQLANRLEKFKGENPLILAIPRGGVAIGSVLANKLSGDLDIILTRKLRTPGNPELAMGSVDESGAMYLNESVLAMLRVPPEKIREERHRQLEVIRRRAESYRRVYPKVPMDGRTVIIVDDGIATGSTMRAAIEAAKAGRAKKLVVALPVGPPEQVAKLEPEVDEVVCLRTPANFMAVGQFYESFEQVSDEEVKQTLTECAQSR